MGKSDKDFQQIAFFESPVPEKNPARTNAEILSDPSLLTVEIERHPHNLPDDLLEKLENFLSGATFRESVKYPAFLQHSYVMGKWGQAAFVAFMDGIIAVFGYDGTFGKNVQRYIEIDDYKYWVYREFGIINREHINVARLRKRMGKTL